MSDPYSCMDCGAKNLGYPGRCQPCQDEHDRQFEEDVARQEFLRDAAADYYEPQEGLDG